MNWLYWYVGPDHSGHATHGKLMGKLIKCIGGCIGTFWCSQRNKQVLQPKSTCVFGNQSIVKILQGIRKRVFPSLNAAFVYNFWLSLEPTQN